MDEDSVFKPSATMIAHSIWANGQELITMELEHHRFIHSEFMTHRRFSRNAASSRAIPIRKVIDRVRNEKVYPLHWGANQSGMQAYQELSLEDSKKAAELWDSARETSVKFVEALSKLGELGLHKQVANRILEPYSSIKVIVTGTRKAWEDFFYLRCHEAAQPEIQVVARAAREALEKSKPINLQQDDWHMPYFGNGYWARELGVPFEEAALVSISCCAQVSYRTQDDSLEKAKGVFERLNMNPDSDEPMHGSPSEHQATQLYLFGGDEVGGNFGYGFVQLRKLLEFGVKLNEVYANE